MLILNNIHISVWAIFWVIMGDFGCGAGDYVPEVGDFNISMSDSEQELRDIWRSCAIRGGGCAIFGDHSRFGALENCGSVRDC